MKLTTINATTVIGPSDHGCGYAYPGGCACRDNVGYGPAEPVAERWIAVVR